MNEIKKKKIKIGVVTNSNKISATKILKKLEVFNYLDILVSNTNNIKPKPNPEPYNYAMTQLKVKKRNTLIFEDSPVGILSAKKSGAWFIEINKPTQINDRFIDKILNQSI